MGGPRELAHTQRAGPLTSPPPPIVSARLPVATTPVVSGHCDAGENDYSPGSATGTVLIPLST